MRDTTRLSVILIQFLAFILGSKAFRETVFFSTRSNTGNPTTRLDDSFPCESSSTDLLLSSVTKFARGGDIELINADEEEGIILPKIRNIIRSVLEVSDNKVPIASKVMRSCIKSVEKITGLKLLQE